MREVSEPRLRAERVTLAYDQRVIAKAGGEFGHTGRGHPAPRWSFRRRVGPAG
ncbi:hypothetical protein [Streptomyces sp. NPDC127098]|uniref:hypothetical protein n=1 Tax=Streptomyces sp. NPDC127098 TaxID=3347137 RepID=UPI0036569348